ncbi:MAG: methyltransferase domain-containing protein [Synechococcales cyanobacterium]
MLQQRIQRFYDASSGLWEQVWGEHMHHGYYGRDGLAPTERRQAQIDLIDTLLSWAGVTTATQILDVGCGIGGSTLYLAQRYQAQAVGITLSPVQARRAQERAQERAHAYAPGSNAPPITFQVADAMAMPFEDQRFDLVWSLESGEHMPDKARLLAECVRVLRPGGTLILATWCHRPLGDQPLTPREQEALTQIYRLYHLPYVIALDEYQTLAQGLGLHELQAEDWSVAVAPFWDAVIGSIWDPAVLWRVLRAGWMTVQGARATYLMRQGYRTGLIRFGVLSGRRGA